MNERFFDTLDRIDEQIARGPSNIDFVHDVAPLLEEASASRYFFENIEAPQWIDVLLNAGVFTQVPGPVEDPDGSRSYPSWDVSRFLTRIAESEPEPALTAMRSIPDTGNPLVHRDLIQALLSVPPGLAAPRTHRVREWISHDYRLFFAEDVAELSCRLAHAGYVEEAIDLLRSLLHVSRRPEDEGGEEVSLVPTVEARVDSWRYNRILEEYVLERLLPVAGIEVVGVVSDVLEEAIRLTTRESEGHEDHSYIWHPAISESRDTVATIRSALVTAVRRSAEALIVEEPELLPLLVDGLEARRWTVFRRLSLHLLTRASEIAPSYVEERLTDRKLFEDVGLRNEYVTLLSREFDQLTDEGQQTILGWIDEGPDVNRYRRVRQQVSGDDVAPEEFEKYREKWQRDRLAFLKGELPDQWEQRLSELEDRHGPAADISRPFRSSGVWVGPTSPTSEEELENLPTDQIVEFLQDWNPSDDLKSPSREGLARTLTSIVPERAEDLTANASLFQGISPVYLAGYFRGVERAASDGSVQNGKPIHWGPLLALAEWASQVSGPERGKGTNYAGEEFEAKWKDVRRALLGSITAGFDSESSAIPTDEWKTVWGILEQIAGDPDPTPAYESEYLSGPGGAYTTAINTVRGRAVDSVVKFALWLHRDQRAGGIGVEGNTSSSSPFDQSAPSVFGLLDRHVEPEVEPSRAVHSVFGRWYPWLLLMNESWAVENSEKIFPQPDEDIEMWEAAWNAYILYCPPYDAVFEALPKQYSEAISRLTLESTGEDLPEKNRHLASHLMTFYWRGRLEEDGERDLIDRFFDTADGTLRRHAIEFVGRSLNNTSDPIPPDIIERLDTLFESRLAQIQTGQPSEADREELGAYLSWLTSQKLDDRQTLERLVEALNLGAKVDWGMRRGIQGIEELSSDMPLLSAQAISALIRNVEDPWEISTFVDEIRAALERVISGGDPEAEEEARHAADELGRRGFVQFRDLSRP